MDSRVYSRTDEIEDTSASRPHLVILGAGASVAACPNGDRNGRRLPVMANLVETVGLGEALEKAGIEYAGRNFEEVYGEISTTRDLRVELEERVAGYFADLQLPDEATIYDYLILCLREKDFIATFNWDPFLWQAFERNRHLAKPPQLLFLHGCAVIGYCRQHTKYGSWLLICPACMKRFTRTKLLYPVADKDYVSDPHIESQWETIRAALKEAFLLTIFGYSAPATDRAAIDLMSEGWGAPKKRRIEEIEIIDKLSKEELARRWRRFIFTHHYTTTDNFFESMIAMHPRRSVEAMRHPILYGRFWEGSPVACSSSLTELWEWFGPLIEAEKACTP